MPVPRILIVDDDPTTCTLLAAIIVRRGYAYGVAIDGSDAITRLRRDRYDAVLLDLMLPKMTGFEVLHFLHAERPQLLPHVIVLTAASEITLRHFDASSIRVLLHKPFDIHQVVEHLDACCGIVRASVEERTLSSPSPE